MYIYGHAPYFRPLSGPTRVCGGWARKHLQALGWVGLGWAGMIKYRTAPTATPRPNKSAKQSKEDFSGSSSVLEWGYGISCV